MTKNEWTAKGDMAWSNGLKRAEHEATEAARSEDGAAIAVLGLMKRYVADTLECKLRLWKDALSQSSTSAESDVETMYLEMTEKDAALYRLALVAPTALKAEYMYVRETHLSVGQEPPCAGN